MLPIPRRFYEAGIRRYGFHGLSYSYLMHRLPGIAGEIGADTRIILAHLGSGASLAAVKDGKSIDTSMGFTAAGGTMMGSRPGDLDPGAVWAIIQKEQLSAQQLNDLINHQSGLLGVSETSSDLRDLLKKRAVGSARRRSDTTLLLPGKEMDRSVLCRFRRSGSPGILRGHRREFGCRTLQDLPGTGIPGYRTG